MPQHPSPPRGQCRSALALIALLANVNAAETVITLDPMVVSALRVPQDPSTVTSAVTRLDPEELQNEGIYQLRDALNFAPGVISTSTGGQTGAIGSLFIRGTNTAYSQLVIDGMRLSDSTTQLGNLLGASRTYDVGNIEVLRGPQGAIYGGESIGGVLWMETPRGTGSPHGSTTVEAGSFDSFFTHTNFQGTFGNTSYYLGGSYERTANDGPDEDFHQGTAALRVEGTINPVWTLGTTFRMADAYFNDHGNADDHLDAALATIYATAKFSDCWTARFLVGFHQEFYDSDSAYGNFGTDMRDRSISTDHEIKLAENFRLLAGAYAHQSDYENTIGTDENRSRYGAYTAAEWEAVENLTATAAVRWEDYDAFGDQATWRVGAIYNLTATGTSFRGGIGTSFRSPTYLDLFGSSFGAGNPDLKAESSLGWDFGIAQEIGKHHTVEATWFKNRITDQIQSFPAPPFNVSGDTTTQGLELGARGSWCDNALNYRLAWTWLDKSLSDQPRNAITGSVDLKPTTKSLVGIGATHLSDHSWGGDPIDAYTVVRLYGSYQLTDHVKLTGRVENVLDENYQLASFFGDTVEGAGTGIYAGLTIDW